MAKQKLYTEEQVRKMLLQDNIFDINDILDSEIPIEFPSDEEIKKMLGSNVHDYYKGAKWMREQILNK